MQLKEKLNALLIEDFSKIKLFNQKFHYRVFFNFSAILIKIHPFPAESFFSLHVTTQFSHKTQDDDAIASPHKNQPCRRWKKIDERSKISAIRSLILGGAFQGFSATHLITFKICPER